MRWLVAILIEILILSPLPAQSTVAPKTTVAPGSTLVYAPSGCPYTYAFPGSGALAAPWAVAGNNTSMTFNGQTLINNSGVGQASSSFIYASEIVTGSTCTFNLAQYAQSTIPTLSVGNSGVWWYVLMNTAGTGYQAQAIEISGNPTVTIHKCSSGSCSTTLVTCGNSWAVGSSNTWQFASSGTTSAVTLTIYYNGTSICTYTDSSSPIITGYPGVGVNDNGSPVTTVASFQAD